MACRKYEEALSIWWYYTSKNTTQITDVIEDRDLKEVDCSGTNSFERKAIK
jgi:hypothetical protein